MLSRLLFTLAFLALCSASTRADDANTFTSPGGSTMLKLVSRKAPGTFSQRGSLEFIRDGKLLRKWPMDGFIFNASWSPDGDYVFLNNRHGISGNSVWVISTKDAVVIKKFEDKKHAESILAHVTTLFSFETPDCTPATFSRSTTFGSFWDDGTYIGDLYVTTILRFKTVKTNRNCIAVYASYHITKDKLVLATEDIESEPGDFSIYLFPNPSGDLVFGPNPPKEKNKPLFDKKLR